jgi:hypothetical protein
MHSTSEGVQKAHLKRFSAVQRAAHAEQQALGADQAAQAHTSDVNRWLEA